MVYGIYGLSISSIAVQVRLIKQWIWVNQFSVLEGYVYITHSWICVCVYMCEWVVDRYIDKHIYLGTKTFLFRLK